MLVKIVKILYCTFNVCNKSLMLTGGNGDDNTDVEQAIAKAVACSISSTVCFTEGTCPSGSTMSVGLLYNLK